MSDTHIEGEGHNRAFLGLMCVNQIGGGGHNRALVGLMSDAHIGGGGHNCALFWLNRLCSLLLL